MFEPGAGRVVMTDKEHKPYRQLLYCVLKSTVTAMFLRTVKARGRKGEKHEYLHLMESYREDGHTKQRVVVSLGRRTPWLPT